MSKWDDNAVQARVVEALQAVRTFPTAHHFGRPYVSGYQLAIALEQTDPDLRNALGKPIGGVGTAQHDSFPQYLANQLSSRIGREGTDFPVEGAFLSNDHILRLEYNGPDGSIVRSSLVGSGWDMAVFRLRSGT